MSLYSKLGIALTLLVLLATIILATMLGMQARFYHPGELAALKLDDKVSIKLGGQVQPTSLKLSKKRGDIRFSLIDKKAVVKVQLKLEGKKPYFLEEGKFIVAVGTMKKGRLQATALLDHYYYYYILASYVIATLVLGLGLIAVIVRQQNTLKRLQTTVPGNR